MDCNNRGHTRPPYAMLGWLQWAGLVAHAVRADVATGQPQLPQLTAHANANQANPHIVTGCRRRSNRQS